MKLLLFFLIYGKISKRGIIMIKIICVGKLKENYLKEASQDYLKRINKYHKINII